MGADRSQPFLARCALALLPALLLLGLVYLWIAVLKDDPVAPPGAATVSRTAETAALSREHDANRHFESPEAAVSGDPAGAAAFTGRVVDEDGRPLGGVGLRLVPLSSDDRNTSLRETSTAADGRFVFERLDPDPVYTLTTLATDAYPAYQLEGFNLDRLPQPFEIRLERLDPITIEGTVVDADHAPLADFNLTVASLDGQVAPRSVTSDASGYFRIDDFPAGALSIYSAPPDYHRIQGLRAESDRYRNLTLVVDRGRYTLSGRVVDPNGAAVAGARITLNSVIATAEYHSHAYRTHRSDENGRFRFDNLGGGPQVLGVYTTGFRAQIENHVFQSYADEIVIELQR